MNTPPSFDQAAYAAGQARAAALLKQPAVAAILTEVRGLSQGRRRALHTAWIDHSRLYRVAPLRLWHRYVTAGPTRWRDVLCAAEHLRPAERAGRHPYQGEAWGASFAAQDAATAVLMGEHLDQGRGQRLHRPVAHPIRLRGTPAGPALTHRSYPHQPRCAAILPHRTPVNSRAITTTWRTCFMSLEPQPADAGRPRRVRLPDSLMRAIRLIAADPTGAPVAAVETAVLITFGYAVYEREETIDPCAFTIPTEQWTAISQALLDVPTASEVGRVNLGLDWVNLGPSAVDDVPPLGNRTDAATPTRGLPNSGGDHEFPVTVWQEHVAAGTTRLGYGPWVSAQRLLAQHGVSL